MLYGNSDGNPIVAEGDNLDELEQSCAQLSTLIYNTDNIDVALNGGLKKTYTQF